MARKKKMSFKLDPEWLLKEPLDFEFNKYTLLDYLQKCEKRFDKFEIYPDFVELSLHLANLQILVWEYDIRKIKGDEINSKTYLNLIFEDSPIDLTLPTILDNFSTWNTKPYYQELPVFEMKNTQDFPMEATLIPIVKRKIMAYVYQVVNFEKIKNFDSEI